MLITNGKSYSTLLLFKTSKFISLTISNNISFNFRTPDSDVYSSIINLIVSSEKCIISSSPTFLYISGKICLFDIKNLPVFVSLFYIK
jgi:hypothetical protein